MEQHGEKPVNNVVAIIPARYESVRLPGKMLFEIDAKPLILHTLRRTAASRLVDRVVVATDDTRIYDAVVAGGGEAVMTSDGHASGSDRIAEVAANMPDASIIVNVQGDEPMISPETIDRAVEALLWDSQADMSTTFEPISSVHGELLNGNVVKVLIDDNGYARHFSRSPMPFPREASLRYGGDPGRALEAEPDLISLFRKHTGLYAYRREYLLKFTRLPQTSLEKIESLEQLRALEDGAKIRAVEAAGPSIGVDTPQDFRRVKDLIECGIDFRRATHSDMPHVARVHVDSWQRSFAGIAPDKFLNDMSVEKRLESYAGRASECGYTMIVADHPDAGIVGFGDFGPPSLPFDFDRQIYSFYFLPEFQRRGLGERLFRRCVAEMMDDGTGSLCLDSLEVSPYRRFYEKMGARIVGRDSHKLGDQDFETVIYGWDDIGKI
ncbi:MAG TPA: 3-deoxy-manno-octulosonate cytidylyltransferase [Pyrinomonadaceae bacterium]|nr:3-deoxy-manno-octulosonate cytidylyltransferase [Pyrinomonadaceae bacterium]